jgi:cell division protein ZapA
MAQVSVSIGGRAYRLACNPGEEAHLEGLARNLDQKIREMRSSFGEIGDQRLVVMAALMVADEASEARRQIEAEAVKTAAAQRAAEEARAEAEQSARALARTLDEMTARIDALAATLAGPAKD